MKDVEIHEQVSPVEEICWRCCCLGLDGAICPGEEHYIFIGLTDGETNGINRPCCNDCYERFQEECDQFYESK